MLREIESGLLISKEKEAYYRTDSVIIGSGIMGLLLAKKLTDLGQGVVLIESKPKLSAGSSIKNHGWLHKGTVHSLSIEDIDSARQVVQKLIYGHEYIKNYASECVEDPFEPIFIATESEESAERAVANWNDLGIFYEEIEWEKFIKLDPNISREKKLHIFRTADLLINNRVLFQKLLTDIRSRGALILEEANFSVEDTDKIKVRSGERNINIEANLFIYCVGSNIGEEYKKLTGQDLDISFWKSHLIFLPKFNSHTLVCLDRGAPIIVNHKDIGVVNKAYDEIERQYPDQEVQPEKVEEAFDAALKFYPGIGGFRDQAYGIACAKPTIKLPGATRHSVDAQVFEPVQNHYFILPGKMTEAPYVADEFIQTIYSKMDFDEITPRPFDDAAHKVLIDK